MHSEIPPHEKIRFRRSDIASLDRLPSAVPPSQAPVPVRRSGGAVRLAFGAALALALVAAAVVGVVTSGIGNERLRVEVQSALAALLGDAFALRIGNTRATFDGLTVLALEAGDVSVSPAASDAEIARMGSARFGLRLAPLLRGETRIGQVALAGIRLDLSAMPDSGPGAGLPFLDEDGLVDTDAVSTAILDGTGGLTALLSARDIDRIELEDAEIVFVRGVEEGAVRIASAVLERESARAWTLSGQGRVGDRSATIDGGVSLASGGAVEAVSLRLDLPAHKAGAEAAGIGSHFDGAWLALAGSRQAGGKRVTLAAGVSQAHLPIGRDGMIADARLDATLERGAGKVEIDRLQVSSGRSTWNFHGAVGPMPDSGDAGDDPAYRFELVSDGSTVAPAGSPEPTLPVVARVGGRLDATARQLDLTEVGVRSGQGEVSGNVSVRFEPGESPGLGFRFEVADMPVGQVKQLWPWFSAPSARNWVLANVFGGRVENGWVEMEVPPGRLGNGVPLGTEEVAGNFVIRGTRFDVAGRIPPVRDGNGTVDFRGTDVDITLDSGTAFLPSGRVVDASNGRLAIHAAHIRPVIGKLEIDVEGEADAVLALAGYEPIDVSRFVDIAPEEISGKVNGIVQADIPLQSGIPVESLDWRVALDYEGLALTRPFDGQTVSQAAGSIVVDPSKAVIDARATMNGAPATVHLVEPLGPDKTERSRRIAMQLDDRARRALAPGLDTILSGMTELELDDASAGRRAIKVALDRATLTLPWVGWSKGSGVPATAAFAMETQGNRIALSDFRLNGESFGASGALSLVDGTVVNARFPSARLNRGDDFSVDMKAQGRGYAITIRGRSADARSLVKLHMGEGGGSDGSGTGVPVTVDLAVDSMTGFHGETLRDVKFAYSGTGDRTDRLEFSAITASGRQVTFTDGRDGGTRKVAMRSADAGAVLRFLDIYEHMQGGEITLALSAAGDGPLTGEVDARDFWVVDEPRLSSIVSTAPQNDGRSLNQAVRGDIDTRRVHFERGYSRIAKEPGTLSLNSGVLRGPLIGMTFQGTLYDQQGNMAVTGTFMPAYGINRIFGEIPLIGQILGNGRDRGLIGITFRLAGKADEPQLQVNPLSVIAPGIFRSVFEFR